MPRILAADEEELYLEFSLRGVLSHRVPRGVACRGSRQIGYARRLDPEHDHFGVVPGPDLYPLAFRETVCGTSPNSNQDA